jgi:cytochrome c
MRWPAAGLWLAGALVAGKASAGTTEDIAAGLNMFDHGCTSCHDDSPYLVKATGPALSGVVGRPVGSLAGFSYSPALQAAKRNGDIWTTGRLELFLANPGHMYPGTTMPWSFSADADRRRMVAYLKSLKSKPARF